MSDWKEKFLTDLPKNIKYESIYQDIHKYYLIVPFVYTISKDTNYKKIYINDTVKRIYKNNPIYNFTNYNAFYPKGFYPCYEILNKNIINATNFHKFCIIEDTEDLGMLEACMKWCHDNTRYENHLYYHIPLKNYNKNNKFNDIYNFLQHDFSFSVYKLAKIEKYYKNSKFDTIFIDTKNSIHLLVSLALLQPNGNIIATLNNSISNMSKKVISIMSKYLDIDIIKPEIVHPLDTTIYIIGTNMRSISENDIKDITKILISDKINVEVYKSSILNEYDIQYNDACINIMKLIKENLFQDNIELITKDKIDHALKWIKKNGFTHKSYFDKYIIKSKCIIQYIPEYKSCELNKYPNIIKTVNNKKLYHKKLHILKRKVNKYKRMLLTMENNIENDTENDIIDINNLLNCIDIYRGLECTVAFKYNCGIVTASWLKLYEIIINENILSEYNVINAFHINEVPGEYILSINHYAQTHNKQYNWYAHSLNPFVKRNRKKVKDSYGLIYNNKKKWLYGDNNTGDLMDIDIIKSYADDDRLQDINFMTANIATNNLCSIEIERNTLKNIYGQVLTILSVLQNGGNCIFKLFLPLTETFTISLLYLMNTLFKTVSIHKPLRSNLLNSEVYIVCKTYFGVSLSLLDKLMNLLNNFDPDISIVPYSDIKKFVNDIKKDISMFTNCQISYIKRSLYYRYNYYDDYKNQNKISEERSINIKKWLDMYNIKKITNSNKIKVD
jgi:hypothetical protein